jgi:two-component system, cell cycle sensor histidine kinase and response regulator CckA
MILLIEDQEALQIAVSLSLQKSGFAVLAARDGTSALDLFRERMKDIDVVVLDATLPDLSGAEVYKQLTRLKPEIKIVVTSGYDLEQVTAEFAPVGEVLFHFIPKPYRVNDLIRTLQQMSTQKRKIDNRL